MSKSSTFDNYKKSGYMTLYYYNRTNNITVLEREVVVDLKQRIIEIGMLEFLSKYHNAVDLIEGHNINLIEEEREFLKLKQL